MFTCRHLFTRRSRVVAWGLILTEQGSTRTRDITTWGWKDLSLRAKNTCKEKVICFLLPCPAIWEHWSHPPSSRKKINGRETDWHWGRRHILPWSADISRHDNVPLAKGQLRRSNIFAAFVIYPSSKPNIHVMPIPYRKVFRRNRDWF